MLVPMAARGLALLALLAPGARGAAAAGGATTAPVLRVESGVTEDGDATDQWLAMIRKRLPPEAYDAVAPLRKPPTAEERSWDGLIRSRITAWERETPALTNLFRPIAPPASVLIVIGNRGAEDAFTHDPTTIGFDLSALQKVYGAALTADLSWGPFDRKWGALTAALWLDQELETSSEALRDFAAAGPGGVWGLADRHLPEALRSVLREAQLADSLCANRKPPYP